MKLLYFANYELNFVYFTVFSLNKTRRLNDLPAGAVQKGLKSRIFIRGCLKSTQMTQIMQIYTDKKEMYDK
jgi:hypothetical protein